MKLRMMIRRPKVRVGPNVLLLLISLLRLGGLPLGRKLFALPATETHRYCYRPV